MEKLTQAIQRIETARDETEDNQLTTYVKNCTYDVLTEAELREHAPEYVDYLTNEPGRAALSSMCIGYTIASALPVERKRELFEQDDWGSAWELADGEDTELYENDEGARNAYDNAISIIREVFGDAAL